MFCILVQQNLKFYSLSCPNSTNFPVVKGNYYGTRQKRNEGKIARSNFGKLTVEPFLVKDEGGI